MNIFKKNKEHITKITLTGKTPIKDLSAIIKEFKLNEPIETIVLIGKTTTTKLNLNSV